MWHHSASVPFLAKLEWVLSVISGGSATVSLSFHCTPYTHRHRPHPVRLQGADTRGWCECQRENLISDDELTQVLQCGLLHRRGCGRDPRAGSGRRAPQGSGGHALWWGSAPASVAAPQELLACSRNAAIPAQGLHGGLHGGLLQEGRWSPHLLGPRQQGCTGGSNSKPDRPSTGGLGREQDSKHGVGCWRP